MTAVMLALALLGLLLSALFSGAETGFYRATRLRLVLDAMGGGAVARGLLFLANHPSLFVATALVGNSLANYLVTLSAVVILEGAFPGRLVEWIAPLLLAPVLLVYGELLPKNLFLQAPNRLLRRVGPLFLFFVAALLPISAWLWGLSRLLARGLGPSPEPVRLILARRELRRVLDEGHEAGILHPAQRRSGARDLRHRRPARRRLPHAHGPAPPGDRGDEQARGAGPGRALPRGGHSDRIRREPRRLRPRHRPEAQRRRGPRRLAAAAGDSRKLQSPRRLDAPGKRQ